MCKYIIGSIGILLTIAGWLLSNIEHFPFIYEILFPKYCRAKNVLSKMHQKSFVLKKFDQGFEEITEVIKENLRGNIKPIIEEIKTLNWGQSAVNTANGVVWKSYIEIEVKI